MPILYSFRRCPYAMRARMALRVSGVDYEHREILLRDKPHEMLDVSTKGTVPVLVLDDDRVLDESFDIMLWALGHNDPQGWLSPGLDTMLPMIDTITGDFKTHLDRYKYASRYNADTTRGSVDLSHREQACAVLEAYEQRLSKTSYLMGSAPSLADYAIFPFIRQFANVERDWWDTPRFPVLHAWLEGFLDTDIFKHVMQKHPVWQANPSL
ncbi:MAG: glutathione S-transferase [Robiginitomaculum sp.]|nr:MAG: glutathione S-transferase [Robiginitomaculum sp.]